MQHEHASPPADGIVPRLAELMALRALAHRPRGARKGRFGVAGHAASPMRGRGMEYAESREYVAGDDVRHIDWRLTARSGRTHTKLFQAERERMTLLVCDTAPELYFGTRVRFKSVQAARAGAVAAWAAIREGDRVAALRGSRAEAPVPPAGGTRGALRVLDALVRWYAAAPAQDDGLASALEHAVRLLRPGSRLLVLASPHSLAAIPRSRWTGLAAHHEVQVLLLVDALELAPPTASVAFRLGQQRLELDLAHPVVRTAWHHEFSEPCEQQRRQLQALGIRVQVLASDDDSAQWLAWAPASAAAAEPA